MIEKFDKITNNLEGENVLLSVSDSKVLNQIDIDTYKIDLKSLEDVSTEDKNMYINPEEVKDWHNLDIRLIDVINSFIATSERPFFLIRDDILVYMNQAAMLFFDIGPDMGFIGNNFFNLVVKEDWNMLSENIGAMLTEAKESVVRIKNSKGKITPAKLKAIYLPESDHFSFILIGEHKENKNKEMYDGLYDEATGLPNFFLFEDRVQVAVVNENIKEKADDVSMLAVIALNIDNIASFKRMNIDDFVLNKLADNLVLNLPKTTTVSVGLKYSFWILLKQKSKEELIYNVNRILEILEDGIKDNFTKHKLQFSMGVSYFPQKARSAKKLMEQAIKALEENQKNRKNKYIIFDEK